MSVGRSSVRQRKSNGEGKGIRGMLRSVDMADGRDERSRIVVFGETPSLTY